MTTLKRPSVLYTMGRVRVLFTAACIALVLTFPIWWFTEGGSWLILPFAMTPFIAYWLAKGIVALEPGEELPFCPACGKGWRSGFTVCRRCGYDITLEQ